MFRPLLVLSAVGVACNVPPLLVTCSGIISESADVGEPYVWPYYRGDNISVNITWADGNISKAAAVAYAISESDPDIKSRDICSSNFRDLLCLLSYPRCVNGVRVRPCPTVCEAVLKSCNMTPSDSDPYHRVTTFVSSAACSQVGDTCVGLNRPASGSQSTLRQRS